MDTWRSAGWGYRCWDERDLQGFELAPQIVAACAFGIYDAAADIMRAEILWRHGGIYADADSERLRSLDRAPFLKAGFFAVREEPPDGSYFVTNSFMGAVPGHPVLRRYMDALKDVRVPPRCKHARGGYRFCCAWSLTGPVLLTRVLEDSYEIDIRILEPGAFFDRTIRGEKVRGRPYGRHFWSLTGERTEDKEWFAGSVAYPERTA